MTIMSDLTHDVAMYLDEALGDTISDLDFADLVDDVVAQLAAAWPPPRCGRVICALDVNGERDFRRCVRTPGHEGACSYGAPSAA